MTRNPTSYYRPKTVEEAVQLVTQSYVDSALLSGGTLRLATTDDLDCEAVIDLQAIPGLDAIILEPDGTLRLGANATLHDVATHNATPSLLRQALTRSLVWNRRNGITVGEAVEFSHDLPEVTAALLALDAVLIFATPQEQRISLDALAGTLTQPKLPARGLITSVEIPLLGPYAAFAEAHVARTHADAAIVSVSAALVTDENGVIVRARLALTGVWTDPARLAMAASAILVGEPLNEASMVAALTALDNEIAPEGDYRGSAEYRRQMAWVLTRRVLAQCQTHFGQNG